MNLCDELVEYVLSYFVKEYSETEAYLNNEMLFATQSCRQLNDAKKRLLQNYSCQYAPITYAIQGDIYISSNGSNRMDTGYGLVKKIRSGSVVTSV